MTNTKFGCLVGGGADKLGVDVVEGGPQTGKRVRAELHESGAGVGEMPS